MMLKCAESFSNDMVKAFVEEWREANRSDPSYYPLDLPWKIWVDRLSGYLKTNRILGVSPYERRDLGS